MKTKKILEFTRIIVSQEKEITLLRTTNEELVNHSKKSNEKIYELCEKVGKLLKENTELKQKINQLSQQKNPISVTNWRKKQTVQSEFFLVQTNGKHTGNYFEGEIIKCLKSNGGADVGYFSKVWQKSAFKQFQTV